MTPHAVSSDRVARSWLLEKILGPEKKESAPARGHTLTDSERGRVLEDAYKDLKADLIGAMEQEFVGLDQAEKRIAKKYHLDPLFLNWFLMSARRSWPTMPTRTKKALRAIQSARIWFAQIPSTWTRMNVPPMEQGRSRDAALRELGEWFLKNFAANVERRFTNAIWTKSRELLHAFKGPHKGDAGKASVLLLRDFKNRLGADHFQLKPAVRRLVELFD